MRKFFSVLFVILLTLPAILGLPSLDTGPDNGDKLGKVPGWYPRALAKTDYYTAWRHYFDDRLNRLTLLTIPKRWFDYRVFAMTDSKDVHVGRDGWLFDRYAVQSHRQNDCREQARLRAHVQEVFHTLRMVTGLGRISGRPVVVSIAPDKSTIYPEYLGEPPPVGECGKNAYDLWLETNAQTPLDSFVRLDDCLLNAKSRGIELYQKAGTSWTPEGVDIVSRTLMASLLGDGPFGSRDDDLTAKMLGRPAAGQSTRSKNPWSDNHLSSILVYGGSQAGKLLNGLAGGFDRVDRIDASQIPSLDYHERITDYDAVLILIQESRLADVYIDLDRWCAMLSVDELAVAKNTIPLNTIKTKKHISIDMDGSSLTIKSMGAGAFFTLPALPGSGTDTLRMLKLKLDAPRADTLRWTDNSSTDANRRDLRPGPTELYLPLAQGPSVRLDINPGAHTGIYHLASAELLEFDISGSSLRTASPSPSTTNDRETARGKIVWPSADKEPPEPETRPPQKPSPKTIVLNDVQPGSIFQRKGTSANIVISGRYTGEAKAIEARVEHFETREPVVPWTVIDSAPTQGIFMGILSEVPQGGWYRIAVRFSDQHTVADTGKARWAVGILVACIGQSNMEEWFYSGNDLSPHSLTGLHRKGRWQPASFQGNGATAFANRLIGRTGVPVGLLDYAVNGSGLCKEADWGTGYWADQSRGSIYRKLVDAVSDAGGALEYVLWMQGEADAARATISKRQYRQTLTAFIEQQIRKDIINGSTQPKLPFLLIGMVKRPIGKDAPHQAVRNAQWQVIQDIPQCYMAATTMDLKNLGRQHLAPEAYTTLGLRTAQTILYLLGEETYYRGPTVISSFKIDPRTIEVRLLHRGGNDFQPQSGITGWRIFQGSEKIPIEDVSRADSRTIHIRLANPVQGSLHLSYLYGAMPDTKHPIRDNSAMELPLESYEQVIP